MATVTNMTLTSANTEYSFTPIQSSGWVDIQARTTVDIKVALASGETTTKWFTIKGGQSYSFGGPDKTPLRFAGGSLPTALYIACATAGTVVEIVEGP